MGGAKRMMEEAEQQRHTAAAILQKVAIFTCCPVHEDMLLNTGIRDLTPAYKYANFYWANYSEVFESRQQMTDMIKEVAEGYEMAADECPICASNAASD